MKLLTVAVSSTILGTVLSANCPANAWWNSATNQCTCNAGYGKDPNGNCVNTDPAWNNCPQYSTYVAYDKKCVCWAGYQLQGTQCVPQTSTNTNTGYTSHTSQGNCPQFSTYVAVDNQCYCWNGYKMSGNVCVP